MKIHIKIIDFRKQYEYYYMAHALACVIFTV